MLELKNKYLALAIVVLTMSFQVQNNVYNFHFPYRYILHKDEKITNQNYDITSYSFKLKSKETITIGCGIVLNKYINLTESLKSKTIESIKQSMIGRIIEEKPITITATGNQVYYVKSQKGKRVSEAKAIFESARYLLVIRNYNIGTKLAFNLDSIHFK